MSTRTVVATTPNVLGAAEVLAAHAAERGFVPELNIVSVRRRVDLVVRRYEGGPIVCAVEVVSRAWHDAATCDRCGTYTESFPVRRCDACAADDEHYARVYA